MGLSGGKEGRELAVPEGRRAARRQSFDPWRALGLKGEKAWAPFLCPDAGPPDLATFPLNSPCALAGF